MPGTRNRFSKTNRALCRATGEAYETLESRTLMSLLGITLPGNPDIETGGTGSIRYTSTNQNYNISTTDLELIDSSGHIDNITADPSSGVNQVGSVSILVATSGALQGGNGTPAGQDITINGDVTIGSTTYDGTLLTGSILQFGSQFSNVGGPQPGSANFDFRFRATGGLLQSLYFTGQDIGMNISATSSSTFGSNFTSPTNENWSSFTLTSNVKGFIGPIQPFQNSPTIVTTATETGGDVVGTSELSDSATLSGSYNGTGTIDFSLTAPDGSTTDEGVVNVSGDGTYSSPTVVATEVGTYTWLATYSGDTFNNGAIDNGNNESLTVVKASPTIVTNATSTPGNVVGTVLMSDSATLSGSYNGTGTIDFQLTAPDGSTTDEGSVTVNGDGTYNAPSPVLGTEVGTYSWTATYNGDSLNNGAIDSGGANESLSTIKAQPLITTQATETSNVVGSALLSDSATVTGGDDPTGTVSFTLTQPDGSTIPEGSINITDDGTYGVPGPVLATEVGTYIWHASYSGDSLNNGAIDTGANESLTTVPATPNLVTNATDSNGNVVGSALLSDSATLTGTYMGTGTISFTVTQPDGSTVPAGSATVNGDGTYASSSFTATEVGTYIFHASYSGDLLNNGAIDNGVNESATTVKTSPTILTNASETAGGIVGAALLNDSVTVSGGDDPTGTVTFTVTQPDGSTVPVGAATITGDGTYSSGSFVATEVGTYTFHAVYGGDSLNNGAVDNGQNESVTTTKSSPTISTSATETNGGVVGASTTSDAATVSGGDSPTGSITFSITAPDGSTSTVGTVSVTGDNTYNSPSFSVTEVGTYTWHASYSGDSLNNGAIDNGVNESVTSTKSSPTIVTNAAETAGGVVGSTVLSDSATVSGGYNPTGAITFTVTRPDGSTVPAGSATVSGDGTYASATFVATEVGTYTFHANYSGDSLNNGAVDNGTNESVTTTKASPAISTSASETNGGVVGSSTTSDTATVTGGDSPTGSITFSITAPDGSTTTVGTISVSGDNAYNSPSVSITEVGTYTWHASYSGDSLNNGAVDNGVNESVTSVKASPTIVTSASETAGGVVGVSVLSDSATISGSYTGSGSIAFSLTAPDGSTTPEGSVTVTGNGTYSAPSTALATEVGTYTWHASYSGDSLNNGAVDNGVNESVTTVKSSPTIVTNATETAGGVVGAATVSDSATISGGYNVSGTITFTVTQPDGTTVSAGSATVTGDGTYSSTGFTATEVGTYTFHANYTGNSLNNGAVDNGVNESVTTVKSTPSISTQASVTNGGMCSSTTTASDSATIIGGDNPTGTITFTLTEPNNTTITVATVTVHGDGTYSTPAVAVTQVGTYTFHATYSGDSLNNGAVDNGKNESVSTGKNTPTVVTTASDTAGGVVGAATISDSAVVSGGDNPTGSITFVLTAPNNTVASTQTVTVNGDGTYSVPTAVAATQVGTYTWTVTYGGDSLNNTAHDQGGSAEQVSIIKSSPSISTQASITNGGMCGSSTTVSDTVTVSGGDHPTGTVTFTLTEPNGTTITVNTVTINGDGTYASSAVAATQLGVYTFKATYSGDSLNNGAVDPGTNESVSTGKDTPKVSTTASDTNGGVLGSTTTSDSAVLSNGYNETGSITFTLTGPSNTTVYTQTVTVNGNGTYTAGPYTPTVIGTYTWSATYGGDSLNSSAKDQGGSAEQVCIVGPPGGTISGTKFQDLTGNGFSSDDTPLGGVTIDLYKDVNGNGVYNPGTDTLVATTITASNGTYSFTGVQPGKYIVGETVPSGWIETGTPLTYAITVTAGSSSTGNNFDDYQEECNLSDISCIYYVINGCKTVTELSGNVNPGDEVTAYATVAPHDTDELSLVSYTAPDNYWNANDAAQQQVYDSQTVSFSTGTKSQTICIGPVQIPLCNYQIDFVCGPVLSCLGNGSSTNVSYHAQNRFFDSSNGGAGNACPQTSPSISGIVFCDQNVDGVLDNCETLISGATVQLYNSSNKVVATTTTGSNGSYEFMNVGAGTYTVVVTASGDTLETSNPVVVLPNGQNANNNPQGNCADLNIAELCHCSGIEGCAWDDCNNDGKVDYNECGIINVCINLSGYDCLGNKVSLTTYTNDDGCYVFSGLLPGCYTISEGQPSGFTEGTNTCGTVNGLTCGSKTGTDTFCNVQLNNCGDAGIGYNFGEHCTNAEVKGSSASTAFWKNSNGQALLAKLNGSANSTALGTWLATMFPNTYSNVLVNGHYISFASLTNSQIASLYVTNDYNVSTNTAKLNTQVLAAALNCYVTSTTLAGGNYASTYGFTTSANGTGYDVINVGSDGAAFGVANNTSISVLQALNATDDDSVNGVLYASSEVVNGTTYSASTLQSMALTIYTAINNAGGINS